MRCFAGTRRPPSVSIRGAMAIRQPSVWLREAVRGTSVRLTARRLRIAWMPV